MSQQFDLNRLVRSNILNLKPYSSARDEYKGEALVSLDANENPYNRPYNRYPDPMQWNVKEKIAEVKGVCKEQIFLGVGSDEAIDLLYRAFCEPGVDNVVAIDPTYGMYEVCANINNVAYRKVRLNSDFSINTDALLAAVDNRTKLIFICSPNNPTGNSFSPIEIEHLLKRFDGIVVVDEAYIDFSSQPTFLKQLENYPNLVVLQTFSKAWGSAAIRLGMAFASQPIIGILSKIKYPYNVNALTQREALKMLYKAEEVKELVEILLLEREKLTKELAGLTYTKKIYDSDANFVLVKVEDAVGVYTYLMNQGIIVRNRNSVTLCEGCLRITIGTSMENEMLIHAMKQYPNPVVVVDQEVKINSVVTERSATISRKTKETDIHISVNLDNTTPSKIDTGLGFFDHMLDQIAKHGGIHLDVLVQGDLHVDEHHTVEDTAIALGDALLAAVGSKLGMERYGFSLPMDDCLCSVSLDFGGRPWLVWDVEFSRERIGDVPTEMFYHFFKSLSDSAKMNLNIKAEGSNEHHKIEGIFKAFARAMRMAIRRDIHSKELPSTKGVL